MEVNVKNTNNVISKVYKDSIADELGIEVGDLLISINGEPIHDIIEYKCTYMRLKRIMMMI